MTKGIEIKILKMCEKTDRVLVRVQGHAEPMWLNRTAIGMRKCTPEEAAAARLSNKQK